MISKIRLTNFRNFKNKVFEFSPETAVIVGPNASGKTNILESIFLLATGKSFKAKVEEEMIGYNNDLARVIGQTGSKQQLEAVLTRGMLDIGTSRPEKVSRKKLLVNGISKRLIDFAGNLKVVLFGPWDLDMVVGAPSLRRNFLDTVLSQVDREYRRAILSYEKGVRQRNRLLYRIREESLPRSQLLFWDKLLIKNGDYISHVREEFINFANSRPALDDQTFQLEYDKSAISEARLEQYVEEEVAAATTLVGPHRDDFIFKAISDKKRATRELARFGSRGEQRMGAFWLKLAELTFVKEKTQENPTLLLDDIFSELDHAHREIVMEMSGGQQTIITTADPHFIDDFKLSNRIDLGK